MCKYLEAKTRLSLPFVCWLVIREQKDSRNSSYSVPSERFIIKCIQIDDSQGMLRLWVGEGFASAAERAAWRLVLKRAQSWPPVPHLAGRSSVKQRTHAARERWTVLPGGLCSPTTRPLNHYYLPRRRRSVLLYTPCNQIFSRLMIRKTARGSLTDATSWTVLWEIVRKKQFGIGNLSYIFWSITSARASSIKKYKFLKSTRVVWDDGTTP